MTRRARASATLAFAATLTAIVPPQLAPASLPVLSSGNLEIVATVPDAGSVGGRIVGDTLYTTSASGLRVYDLATLDGIPLLRSVVPCRPIRTKTLMSPEDSRCSPATS